MGNSKGSGVRADLQPGFSVINDLSECTLAALSGLPVFKKITDHLITHEVSEVIRIIDEHRIVFKQILHASARMSVYTHTPVYVKSLEEAEELLDLPR